MTDHEARMMSLGDPSRVDMTPDEEAALGIVAAAWPKIGIRGQIKVLALIRNLTQPRAAEPAAAPAEKPAAT